MWTWEEIHDLVSQEAILWPPGKQDHDFETNEDFESRVFIRDAMERCEPERRIMILFPRRSYCDLPDSKIMISKLMKGLHLGFSSEMQLKDMNLRGESWSCFPGGHIMTSWKAWSWYIYWWRFINFFVAMFLIKILIIYGYSEFLFVFDNRYSDSSLSGLHLMSSWYFFVWLPELIKISPNV